MALPVTVPNTFANATTSIPLSQLDNNFSTLANVINDINSGAQAVANLTSSNVTITGGTISNVTLDNVTIQTESFDNVTLSNVTISSGNAVLSNLSASNVAITGGTMVNVANVAYLTEIQTFSAKQTFTATQKIQQTLEKMTVSATAATGTIAYDALTQAALYYTTNASANWTVNFRGDSGTSLDSIMATGESLTLAFLVTQGATAYYNSAVQIDGNSVTPKWQGGTAPTSGNASSIDLYVYNIVKTGSATFTVFASQTQFK